MQIWTGKEDESLMDGQLILSCGSFAYSVDPEPVSWPKGEAMPQICGIAVKGGKLYLANRSALYPVAVFGEDGRFISGFGRECCFVRSHGLWVDDDGSLFVCDDGRHVIYHFSAEQETNIAGADSPEARMLEAEDKKESAQNQESQPDQPKKRSNSDLVNSGMLGSGNKREFIGNPDVPIDIKGGRIYLAVKHVFDFVASAVALCICAIPMVLIALLIKMESPGPAIFKQERLGKDGVPFIMYKFRSMRMDAEKNGPRWADVHDDRCTKIGRLIRRCHADELPQLLNILKGEMSIVGPRPERAYYYQKFEHYLPQFKERLRIKPGLTGLSQVNGCYDLLPEERLAYDITYMENRSMWLDVKCMLKTVWVVLIGRGAR